MFCKVRILGNAPATHTNPVVNGLALQVQMDPGPAWRTWPDLTQTYFGGGSSWGRGGLPHHSASGNCSATPWTRPGAPGVIRPQPSHWAGPEVPARPTGCFPRSGLRFIPNIFPAFIFNTSQHPSLFPYRSLAPLGCHCPTTEMPSLPFKII